MPRHPRFVNLLLCRESVKSAVNRGAPAAAALCVLTLGSQICSAQASLVVAGMGRDLTDVSRWMAAVRSASGPQQENLLSHLDDVSNGLWRRGSAVGSTLYLYGTHERYRLSQDAHEARHRLKELLNQPVFPNDALDAHRLLGQIEWYDFRDLESAAESYSQGRALFVEHHLDDDTAASALWAECTSKLAAVQGTLGNTELANQLREELVAAPSFRLLPAFERQVVSLELARGLGRAGRIEEASAAYTEFLRRFPDYGQQDGLIVYLELERARLIDPDDHSDGFVNNLAAIWSNPEFEKFPIERIRIGHRLASILGDTGSVEMELAVQRELARLIESVLDATPGEILESNRIEAIHQIALFRWGTLAWESSDWTEAWIAYSRFVHFYPDHSSATTARARLSTIRAKTPGAHEVPAAAQRSR